MKAKREGWDAFFDGHTKADCPYASAGFQRAAWMKGRARAIRHFEAGGILDKSHWPKRKVVV